MLHLGKIEKGYVLLQCKYNYLTSQWFRYKHKKNTESKVENGKTYNDVCIERDSLITMKYKQGETDTIEYYRVVGIFGKYYNKWFVYIESDEIMRKKY